MASPEQSVSTLERPCLQDKSVIVYTSSRCPRCVELKGWLRNRRADFEERSLEDVEVMASLIMRNIVVLSAPALEVKGVVYTEDQIFDGNGTVKSGLFGILEGK